MIHLRAYLASLVVAHLTSAQYVCQRSSLCLSVSHEITHKIHLQAYLAWLAVAHLTSGEYKSLYLGGNKCAGNRGGSGAPEHGREKNQCEILEID